MNIERMWGQQNKVVEAREGVRGFGSLLKFDCLEWNPVWPLRLNQSGKNRAGQELTSTEVLMTWIDDMAEPRAADSCLVPRASSWTLKAKAKRPNVASGSPFHARLFFTSRKVPEKQRSVVHAFSFAPIYLTSRCGPRSAA